MQSYKKKNQICKYLCIFFYHSHRFLRSISPIVSLNINTQCAKLQQNAQNYAFFCQKICKIHKIIVSLCPLLTEANGKLSEWSKEPHSKCGVRITSYRGFESLTFRKRSSDLSVQVYLSKQIADSFAQDAVGRLVGITKKSLT